LLKTGYPLFYCERGGCVPVREKRSSGAQNDCLKKRDAGRILRPAQREISNAVLFLCFRGTRLLAVVFLPQGTILRDVGFVFLQGNGESEFTGGGFLGTEVHIALLDVFHVRIERRLN